MLRGSRSAREIFAEVQPNSAQKKFDFGQKLGVLDADAEQACTRTDLFKAAHVTEPRQTKCMNQISSPAREKDMPVVCSRVVDRQHANDAGVGGTGTDTANSLQKITYESDRHQLDQRCDVHPSDLRLTRRMPSAFSETHRPNYLSIHGIDAVAITEGSTSGCVRGTAVDTLSHGYGAFMPVETCADKNVRCDSASLTDFLLKYADVEPVRTVIDWLEAQ